MEEAGRRDVVGGRTDLAAHGGERVPGCVMAVTDSLRQSRRPGRPEDDHAIFMHVVGINRFRGLVGVGLFRELEQVLVPRSLAKDQDLDGVGVIGQLDGLRDCIKIFRKTEDKLDFGIVDLKIKNISILKLFFFTVFIPVRR